MNKEMLDDREDDERIVFEAEHDYLVADDDE
jgi:hypothetical protein